MFLRGDMIPHTINVLCMSNQNEKKKVKQHMTKA